MLGHVTKTFDKENRDPIPRSHYPRLEKIRIRPQKTQVAYYDKAINYVSSHPRFSKHIGSPTHVTLYPITPQQARKALLTFCKARLRHFGAYQDAIVPEHTTLYHSFLSAPINAGILSPHEVLKTVLRYKNAPLNSLEGYVRQLIGWREWCGYLYRFWYKDMIAGNQFKAKRPLSNNWYTASTGIKGLDHEIRKAIDLGYAHHIIRLMVFLNIMVLTEVKPDAIYKWFMEVVAIDAYDWVMRPNLQMMSHYWPRATRKPYISTDAYLDKMSSNYGGERGAWTPLRALFYTWLQKHHKQLKGSAQVYLRNLAYYRRLSPSQKQAMASKTQSLYKRL